jgi:hypothetical protein
MRLATLLYLDYTTAMRKSEFLSFLLANPDTTIRFQLPDHQLSPAHAHVTEVARIDKHFIDCGGTVRKESMCRLQTWVADDVDHRLSAKKLAGIIEKGATIIGDEDLEMDVEHDVGFVTQFPVLGMQRSGDETIIELGGRHTACLAPEKCCPPEPTTSVVSLGRKR